MVGLWDYRYLGSSGHSAQVHRLREVLPLLHGLQYRAVFAAVKDADIAPQLIGQLVADDGIIGYDRAELAPDKAEDVGVIVGQDVVQLYALLLHSAVDELACGDGFGVGFEFHICTSLKMLCTVYAPCPTIITL
ncbi:MAG: hypothetical protein BWZ04_02375 [Firmicutes bacterium ADurb.BinA205]|nr:MAG: hypothetical protein BWZ04_02375 [Firmicutes bacterium ADurb.BinA205]